MDSVLFLRPTESATIFLQQLGAACAGSTRKACLTVLDFIGAQHRRFRFDLRYRALTGATRSELPHQVEDGFPFLPSGCHIHLDRVATKVVLENIRQQLQRPRRELVADLAAMGDVTLDSFLDEAQVDLDDLYRFGAVAGVGCLAAGCEPAHASRRACRG